MQFPNVQYSLISYFLLVVAYLLISSFSLSFDLLHQQQAIVTFLTVLHLFFLLLRFVQCNLISMVWLSVCINQIYAERNIYKWLWLAITYFSVRVPQRQCSIRRILSSSTCLLMLKHRSTSACPVITSCIKRETNLARNIRNIGQKPKM